MTSQTNRFLLLCCSLLLVAYWSAPLWWTPGMRGVGDWDFALHRCEALRKTIVEYHQWPGHNPWANGGIPLLGNPSAFPISVKGILTLTVGSYWAMQLSTLAFLLIGFYGAWKLSSLWWKDLYFRCLFSFLLIANPAMIVHGSLGHPAFLNFFYMYLLFFYILSLDKDLWSGLKAGLVFSLAFIEVPVYMPQYGALIGGGLFCWYWLSNYKHHTPYALRWLALFIPLTLALISYRLVTTWEMVHAYPRISDFKAHYHWHELLNMYFVPHITDVITSPIKWCCNSVEMACYLGTLATIFFLISFRRGIRWWHIATGGILAAAAGNDQYWMPMYWIQKLPTFSSQLCFARIRVFAYIFFGIGTMQGLSFALQRSKELGSLVLRWAFYFGGLLMVIEVGWVSHLTMKSSHTPYPYLFPNPNPLGQFKSIGHLSYPQTAYDALQHNLGWMDGYGESNFPGTTLFGADHPKYIAEFYQHGRPIKPTYWSPNHIHLEGLDPSIPLTVNMNPGKAWHNNGVPAFPNMRIVEMQQPFLVHPNQRGVVDLTYHHPGQFLGICSTLAFGLLAIAIVSKFRRQQPPTT